MAKIKTSDFFENDGALRQFNEELKQGEELLKKYIKIIDQLKNEAKKLEQQNDSLNISTEKGRESIVETTKQTDKLEKAIEKYTEAMDDTAVKIAGVREQTRKLNQLNKIEAKLLATREGSYDNLSAQYAKIKIRLNQMTAAERQSTKAGQELEKNAREIYEQMKDLQEATGKYTLNVGNYKSAIEALPGPLGNLESGLDSVKGAFSALARHPLIAVLALLVGTVSALFNAFKKTERGMKLINQVSGVVNASLGKLVQISESVADGLSFAFENPLEALKSLGKFLLDQLVNRITALPKIAISAFTAIKEAITLNFSAAQEAAEDAFFAMNQLATGLDEKAQRSIASAIANTTKEINEQAQAWTALENARIDVAKQNRTLERSIEDLITVEQELIQIQEDDTRSFVERQEAADKAADAIEKRARLEIQLARNNLNLIEREIALRQANGEAAFDLLDQQVDAYKTLRQAERDLTLSLLEEEEKRRRLIQDTLERDLDILLDGLANQFGINKQLIADDEKTLAERSRIYSETVQLAEDSFAKQIETVQKFTNVQIDANDLLATSDAVLLNQKIRSLGLSEIIEGRILEIIRDRRDATFELVQIERELIAERRKLTAELPKIGSVLDREEFESAKRDGLELVKEAKREIARSAKEEQQGELSFFDLIGLNLNDKQETAIKSAFDFAKQQLTDFFNLRRQLADQRVQEANQNVQAAQTELQTQIQLSQAGYAARVQDAQKELQLARQTQEKAQRDKERAVKAQLAADTIQQTSSLISAAAKIWAQLGFPFALPAIAVMFGSFAASKIKAFQAAKQEFAGGGLEILGGGSHASGNDTPLGFTTKKGKQAYGQRGEAHMILDQKTTRKYRPMLPRLYNALKAGTFESLFVEQRNMTQQIPLVYGQRDSKMTTAVMEMYLKELVSQGRSSHGFTPDGRRYERNRGTLKITG